LLAGFYALIDVWQRRRWAFPLVVIGMNSIAIYCMSWLVEGFVLTNLKTHLGPDYADVFGKPYATLVSGGLVILIFWGILYWMYRRKLFLKV
jgi:predicted acyltransferase